MLCVGLIFVPGRVRLAYLGKVRRGPVVLVLAAFIVGLTPLPLARPAWSQCGPPPTQPPPPPPLPVYFVHHDHLGSTVLLTCYKQGTTCADGAVARYYRYDAYGQPTAYDSTGALLS